MGETEGAGGVTPAHKKLASQLYGAIFFLLRTVTFGIALYMAYDIRMYAIKDFGRLIHEFDPWFNFRATQYLYDNGIERFFKWYDYMSWYPLGRPVGTTIYPGMQLTSVFITRTLEYIGDPRFLMSLNDVCVFIPVWGGTCATLFLGLLAGECSGNSNAAVFSALIMSIIPAHIMRSVGGGYDNESVAMTAICATFYFWVRSLRSDRSWPIGFLAGLAYFYMVAAWGGYIFVLNMVGVHAGILVLLGRFSYKLHHAYSLFFIVGTAGALQIPVVGLAPFKSAEQLGPLGIFFLLQLLCVIEYMAEKAKMTSSQKWGLAFKIFAVAGGVAMAVIAALYPTGYFGPLSVRIRSLFIEHTKTGNMLVDSVAEHQPASPQAYWQYLHYGTYIAPPGFLMCFFGRNDGKYFLICYAIIAYYFSNRMVRLIIIMGPITSALGGVFLANVFDWVVYQFVDINDDGSNDVVPVAAVVDKVEDGDEKKEDKKEKKSKSEKKRDDKKVPKKKPIIKSKKDNSFMGKISEPFNAVYESLLVRTLRKFVGIACLAVIYLYAPEFHSYCHHLAVAMSQPSIVFKARLQSGEEIIVDDYLKAYEWVRDNTPEDARVLAWWDYGYQITGVANRTSVADGNTWSLEHIALLARSLTSEEKKGHRIMKHLADYVLIWTGGGGDDLAKSPHLARIANSVYPGTCSDSSCSGFGFDRSTRSPTRMMRQSALYKLHSNGLQAGVEADPKLWQEVYQSKYGKVRIYKILKVSKESRKWNNDPANRSCDAPGSWYCVGHYPPALEKLNRKFLGLPDPEAAVEDDDSSYSL